MEMNLSDDFIRVLNEKFKKIMKKYKKYLSDKKYRQKNKQNVAIKKKIYYQNKKEKINKDHQIYRKNNKEKISDYSKIYYKNNKEKYSNRGRIYEQTDTGKKLKRINKWKLRGLICDDYDALYQKFINTTNCEVCNVLLTVDKYTTLTTRCMDHDHTTGLFRNVLCNKCNIQRR